MRNELDQRPESLEAANRLHYADVLVLLFNGQRDVLLQFYVAGLVYRYVSVYKSFVAVQHLRLARAVEFKHCHGLFIFFDYLNEVFEFFHAEGALGVNFHVSAQRERVVNPARQVSGE